MAKKRQRKNTKFNLKNLKKFSLKRLAIAAAGTAIVVLGVFGIHAVGNQATKDFIEKHFVNAVDLVRESGLAPAELVFCLDQVVEFLPYVYGESFGAAVQVDADKFTLGGAPVLAGTRTLENSAYLVGYDEDKKNPAWVAYTLTFPKSFETAERKSRFDVDTRTRSRVSHDDYTGTGFDRGHMAPNQAIGAVYGQEAQNSTFLMSNIVPQYHAMNAGVWKDLEQRVLRRYTRNFEQIWVICGPIYGVPVKRFDKSGVAIPEACFLILLDQEEKTGNLRTLSFIVPNTPKVDSDARKYIVSIDEIEARTGIDFLAALSEADQAPIEAYKAKTIW